MKKILRRIDGWFPVAYPIFILALALLRVSEGQYETALYMAMTAAFFMLNVRVWKLYGEMRDCADRGMDLLRTQHEAFTACVQKLRAAFHINMLRAYPDKSHDEISAEIDKVFEGQNQ